MQLQIIDYAIEWSVRDGRILIINYHSFSSLGAFISNETLLFGARVYFYMHSPASN